ncbi:tRNA pseudouridine(38-40) synthase TruA [Virgibacillus sp. 179-BFC.A HS]|uniref:tRNA pseudouridine synthase A n=1 Tax=Tigheibacillus jepli TaxID=3035914 RepID=A0ABU5CLN2_9BACI|nr:tRNA pseudouridine(38-40) synthase TruA [Virgibacillus sp. 179-BFC.A HS]MDY0407259.1 tRNA pseudouridine(38-40) synthase TruA [Virgibacillus sp. 179-BFC.A HS]
MAKIKCIISYDGSGFAGYQIQPGLRTVQGQIENVLARIHKGKAVRVYASGRTDSGVHAIGQTIHFETDNPMAPERWKQALNAMLPDDIHVMETNQVPDTFHARFDVVEKEYHYIVYRGQEADVFKRNYAYHFPYPLDIAQMQQACQYLQGTHDFTTFSSAKSTAKGSRERTLFAVSCSEEGDELTFVFRGSGYLYNMVRIMVGTLLDIGQGKMKADAIPELFARKDRSLAGKTAPPQGLYLWHVTYGAQ